MNPPPTDDASRSSLLPAPARPVLCYGMAGKRGNSASESPAIVLAEYELGDAANSDVSARARALLERDGDAEEDVEAATSEKESSAYKIHMLERYGLAFVVGYLQSETDVNLKRAEVALEELAASFAARIGVSRAKGATRRYAFNAEFSPMIRRQLEKMNALDPAAGSAKVSSPMAKLSYELENVKESVRKNIDQAVERGYKLTNASQTSEVLADVSSQFKSSATLLRKKAWWESQKLYITGLFAAIVVIFLIVWVAKR